jgi:hypothetical protein
VRNTRIVAAAAATVLMAGLTACGGSGDDQGAGGKSGDGQHGSPSTGAQAALAKASASTRGQKSAKVEGTQRQGTPKGTMNTKTEGVVDWSGGGTTAEMTVTQRGGALGGLPTAGKPMPARYTKDAMYLNMGDSFASAVGKGKHWMKYDYDKLAKQSGASGALLRDQMQNNNPARSLNLLLASGKVKEAGHESVGGQPATHYEGTVNASELARMQSKELSAKELGQISSQLKAQGYTTERIDLWIDGKDLLVKKRERATSKSGKLDSTVSYSDYGTDVTVRPPAASDTLGFDDLAGAISKS